MSFLSRLYQKNPTVVTRSIGDEIFLVPTQQQGKDSGSIFTLDDMAAGIWVQIDGDTTPKTIKKRILKSFDANPDQVERDLVDFLLQLEKSGLIMCKKAHRGAQL